jgi:hypothetical protein
MKFAFLALAIAPLLFPLIFQFDKKLFSDGNFKAALGASLVSTIVFSVICIVQHWFGLLSYNDTMGIFFKDIPLEQYLLNFTFSFAAIGLYQYLNLKFPKNDLQRYSLAMSNLLLGLCVAFLFFAYTKWYTLSTFATLLVLLLFIEYIGKLRFMYRAYRAFVVMLVPFYIIYGILFWSGTITIAKNQLSGMCLASIPIENHFVALAMMLVSIYMFEFFRTKRKV